MTKITTASKKLLAVIMAMLTLFSCMALSAGAASFAVPKPECTLNSNKDAITVAPITVNGVAAEFAISSSSGTAGIEKFTLSDGSVRFQGVSTGKTYTITASVTIDSETQTNSTVLTIKKSQAAPEAPKATEITSNSITITSMANCEYAIARYVDNADESSLVFSETVKFTNLIPGELYVIYARKKETTDSYPGELSHVNIRTLKVASTDVPGTPVLVDKTDTTIVVKEIDGVKFSIDGGKNWQFSGTFKGLTAGMVYGIIAQYEYDSNEQEAGPTSAALQVKTNTRGKYMASIKACTFSYSDGKRYSNKEVKITVTGDAPANTTAPQYGDTRYTPTSYRVDNSTKVLTFSSTGDNKTFIGRFVPNDLGDGDKSNKTIKVVVTYTVSKYNGATWETLPEKQESKTYEIEIGPEKNTLTDIQEGLEKVLNFLLNTVPGALNDFFTSDTFGKVFEGIMDFINGIGK